MSASNYGELSVLDNLFTGLTEVFIALHTANPGETGATAEVSGGAYARVSVPTDTSGFDAAATVSGLGTKKNAAIIQFVDPVGANWGTITHFSIWDAATSGNCLVYGALTASVDVSDGDPGPRFNAGDIAITCE